MYSIAVKPLRLSGQGQFCLDGKQDSLSGRLNNTPESTQLVCNRVLATSAAVYLRKRPYCSDYKSLRDSLSVKNIGMQVAKAGILTFAVAMQEYNAYLDKVIAAAEKKKGGQVVDLDEEVPEEFDWNAALPKYLAQFQTQASRFVSTFILRKVYETIAFTYLSSRMADRFTKDLVKSFGRKSARYGRFAASMRIVKTALWSNTFIYLSSLSYDVFLNVYDSAINGRIERTPTEMSMWLSKKATFYTVCSWSAAFGFAFGSYYNPDLAGVLASGVFETIFGAVAAAALGI
jgi:hypothetical protein